MAAGETPNRESVLETLAVVFANSKIKEIVGTDALKSVLSGQYRDLVSGGTLHLQVVWDLLADQPGFEAEDAQAPFCVIKSWQDDLGLDVALPGSLANYSAAEVFAKASQCPVPKKDKERVLNPEKARAKAKATIAEFDAGEPPAKKSADSARKPALEAALGLVAALGIGYGAYAYISSTGGAQFEKVDTANIRTELPVAKAKQLGEELNLLVEEASWYELPTDARKDAVRATLENMGDKKITSIIVQDGSGTVRASAQYVGAPPKIVVRLK